MKLASRPEDTTFGDGEYTLKLTFEQLEFLASMAYLTRLGDGEYKAAVFDLINTLEEAFDEDFLEEAFDNVSPNFSVVDDGGDTIDSYHGNQICIEI